MQWVASFWNAIAQFFGYDHWDWGSAADWVGAIGTAGALIATVVLVGRERLNTRRSQADQVAIRLEDTSIPATIHGFTGYVIAISNYSRMPFASVEVFWRKKGIRGKPASFSTHPETNGEDINPREHIVLTEDLPSGLEVAGDAVAVMIDGQGRTWFRNIARDKYISARRARQFIYGIKTPFSYFPWHRVP